MRHNVPEDVLRGVAANTTLTQSHLDELLQAIQEELQTEYITVCSMDWTYGGKYRHLLKTPNANYFAFTQMQFRKQLLSDIELSDVELDAVMNAYALTFEKWGRTIDCPDVITRHLKDSQSLWPIPFIHSESMNEGEEYTSLRFTWFMKHGLTSAEALDYWIVNESAYNYSISQWAGVRDVCAEAIRKNIRQAKTKLNSEDQQPYRAAQNIDSKTVDED